MASLISKLKTIILGKLNALVDSALKVNSGVVLDEELRHAEDKRDEIEAALLDALTREKILGRTHKGYQASADRHSEDAQRLCEAGRPDLAKMAWLQADAERKAATECFDDLSQQRLEVNRLRAERFEVEAELFKLNLKRRFPPK